MERTPRVRRTARLVVVDEHSRILLFRYEDAVSLDPTRPDLTDYWVTPGGGLEDGETFEEAAQRELWEETGLRADAIDPWLWTRERSLRIAGEPVLFHERFFLARVGHAAVNLANLLPYEREVYRDHRWWPLDELRDTSENVVPEGLANLLAPVLDGYTPATSLTIQ